jgi:hypothetical protein
MKRNPLVLTMLVLAQLAVAYILELAPDLVTWSWQSRLAVAMGVLAGIGAVASLLFVGEMWRRIVWVALTAALPPMIAEAISWSDPAYPYFGYVAAIATAVIAALAAFLTLNVVRFSHNRNLGRTTDKS